LIPSLGGDLLRAVFVVFASPRRHHPLRLIFPSTAAVDSRSLFLCHEPNVTYPVHAWSAFVTSMRSQDLRVRPMHRRSPASTARCPLQELALVDCIISTSERSVFKYNKITFFNFKWKSRLHNMLRRHHPGIDWPSGIPVAIKPFIACATWVPALGAWDSRELAPATG